MIAYALGIVCGMIIMAWWVGKGYATPEGIRECGKHLREAGKKMVDFLDPRNDIKSPE